MAPNFTLKLKLERELPEGRPDVVTHRIQPAEANENTAVRDVTDEVAKISSQDFVMVQLADGKAQYQTN